MEVQTAIPYKAERPDARTANERITNLVSTALELETQQQKFGAEITVLMELMGWGRVSVQYTCNRG